MQIRTRLTAEFTLIVALIVLLSFVSIYALLFKNRKNEFYGRLQKQANTAAELLINENHIDSSILRIIYNSQKDQLESQSIVIYKNDHGLIYSDDEEFKSSIDSNILNHIQGVNAVRFRQGNLECIAYKYTVFSKTLFIIAGAVDRDSKIKNEYLLKLLFILFCIIVIVIPIAGRFFARNALSPLSRVIAQVNNLPAESIEARLFVANSRDEIGQLTLTFNKLLDKIQNSFELQKIFLSAASHEMKNPLTAITSQLQVLQFRTRTTEEYKETVESVLEDLAELNKTTVNLIEYAKLSYEMNIGVALTNIRVDDILWYCKDYIAKLTPNYLVEIKFTNPPKNENELVILANESLLKIAFLNLIDNGCKFSSDKKVVVDLVVQADMIFIYFSDNGIGMKLNEQIRIFEPFYRTNNTSGVRGHGLGLSIVKKIIDIHNAKIDIISKFEEGTSFILKFQKVF